MHSTKSLRNRKEGETADRISNGRVHYQMGAEIGRGGFGVVFQALNVEVGDFVAVKRFPLNAIDAESLSSIEAEIELMKKLNHPNIVKYIDTIRTQDFLHIVLEYMENGSLQHVIKKFGSFSESLTAIYITQVLRGLKYLHEQGVLHRDIKGANILTTKDGQVKLADFGVALKLSDIEGTDGLDVVGTPYWMAPEIIEMSTPTAACDIWSVGCTIVELTTGKPPYFDLAPMAALFRIVQDDYPPLPDGISQALREFLLLCFHKEPTMRSNASKLLEHPWLQNPSNHLSRTTELLTSKTQSESMDEETQGIVNTIKLFRKDVTDQFKAVDLAAQLAAEKISNGEASQVGNAPALLGLEDTAIQAPSSPLCLLKGSSSSLENGFDDDTPVMKTRKEMPPKLESGESAPKVLHSLSYSTDNLGRKNTFASQDDEVEDEDWDADIPDNRNSSRLPSGPENNVDTVKVVGAKVNSGTSSMNTVLNGQNSAATSAKKLKLHGLTMQSHDDISEFLGSSPKEDSRRVNRSQFLQDSINELGDKSNRVNAANRKHVRNNTHVSVPGLMATLAKYQDQDEDVESSFINKDSGATGLADAKNGKLTLEIKTRDLYASADSEQDNIDEFLNYQFDDNDFEQNENKDVHIRRSIKIVKSMERITAESSDVEVVDICKEILNIFRDYPEQREHLITHHGVLPVLNMLEASATELPELLLEQDIAEGSLLGAKKPYVLRVINEIVDGSVRAQEQLSLVGVIPVVMKMLDYKSSAIIEKKVSMDDKDSQTSDGISSIEPVTLEAARFVHQISSSSSLTLQMLIGAGGLPVLVHMVAFAKKMAATSSLTSLNRSDNIFYQDIDNRLRILDNRRSSDIFDTSRQEMLKDIAAQTSEDARRMVYMGVDCIMQVFSVQSSRTRDFCLLFVKLGLLSHLAVAFEHVMAFDRRTVVEVKQMSPEDVKAEEMQCKYALRIATILWNFSRYEVAEQMGKGGLLQVIMKILQSPSLVSSDASNPYFGKHTHNNSTTPHIFAEIVELLLKCIKNLSMEPTATALNDLEQSGAIETLVKLLNGPLRERCKNHVVPCMFNLCRINKKRQEKAAVSGLIPFLQQLVKEESHLKQFALPILFDLAHTSAVARAELWKNNVVVFYINLLHENYWQTQALISLNIWLYTDTAAVEAVMIEPKNLSKLIAFFRTASTQTINTLHKPLLDIMTKSKALARALAISGLYVSSLVKRLEGSEAIVLRSLLRMLQLLHQHHPFPRQFVLDHNLYAIVRRFAQDESQVLVFQMANRLLRDFQTSTIS